MASHDEVSQISSLEAILIGLPQTECERFFDNPDILVGVAWHCQSRNYRW
jgi:hypothetical protein